MKLNSLSYMTIPIFNIKWFELQTTLWLEIIARAFLSIVFLELEQTSPFTRKIHLDEMWLYKNPRTSSYVPDSLLWPLIFVFPTTVLFFHFCLKRNKTELCQGLLSLSLALGLNGVITDTIKLIVGRPRPDFFYRCFPDGEAELDDITDVSITCKGKAKDIMEGRKSFPSGHASFSFCTYGFLTLWLCGKIGVFSGTRSKGWKLILGISPLMVALIIALSRTCDYHHHWQGSMIGLSVSYLCYRQYYPRLSSSLCHLPYLLLPTMQQQINRDTGSNYEENDFTNGKSLPDASFYDAESPVDEQVKWI